MSDCECPRWQPTAMQWDPDGWQPCDYTCPDDSCHCPIHCAETCWCGDIPAVGCPEHLPAPGGAA